MKDARNASAVGVQSDRLMRIADLLLEAYQVVSGQDIRAALDIFRRLDRSVPRPMAVSEYALSCHRAHSLLQSVGMSEDLARRVLNMFARHPRSVNSWSRVVGEAPDRHADALVLFVGLVLICRATLKNKLSILFSLFDSGRTGVLTEDDLGVMISSCSSFLHHVGLSLPISNDEAAFVAGGAFAPRCRQSNSISDDDVDNAWVDELDLPMFLAWALQAELPAHVLELLSLPHRLSTTIDLASAKLLSLRERRPFGSKEGHSQQDLKATACTCQEWCFMDSRDLCRSQRVKPSTVRSRRLRRENGEDFFFFSFTLPPLFSMIGAHEACAMLEVNPGGMLTAEGAMWHVVIALEERIGPRFSVIESELVPLQGGVPLALRLSGLRAATDHRVQLRWNGSEQLQHRDAARRRKRPGRQDCETLRFATLPGVSSVIPEPERAGQSNPRIAIVSAGDRAPIDGSSGVLPSLARSTGRRAGENSTAERSVSVVINYRRANSLQSVTSLPVAEPRWVSTVRSDSTAHDASDQGHPSMLSWPPRKVSPSPEAIKLAPASLANLNAAPFCGDVVTAKAGTASSEAWLERGERGENVDIMVHLSPEWNAEPTVRRCFHILEVCRFENPTVREDARCMVSREICIAIGALLCKSSQPRGRTLRKKTTRSCAHVVLGDIDTWLGLAEEEVETHDEEHRDIVHMAVEVALQRYLWDPGMCGGGGAFTPADGGAMAIGRRCFLMRPGKKEGISPETAVLEKTEVASSSNSQIEVVPDNAQSRNDLGTENAANMATGLESTEIGPDFSRAEGGAVEETTVQGAREEGASNDVEDVVAVGTHETILVTLEADKRETEVLPAVADAAGPDRVASDSEHDCETTPLSGITHRPEDKASDHDAESGSSETDVLHENPILVALLRRMTRAAEESAPKAMKAGGTRTAQENTTLTVIIILDAPLLSPKNPEGGATNRSQHWQNLSNLPERTGEESSSESQSTTGGRATGGDFSDEHPAGLGDPSEALRALVSWTKEGPASAEVRRELLLVCMSGCGDRNITKSRKQEHDDFDDGGSRESPIVGEQTLDTGNSDSGFRGDVKVGSSHDDVIHADDASISARENNPNRIPRDDEGDTGGSGQEIRQVILGRMISSRIEQKNPSIAKEDVGEAHKPRTASAVPLKEQGHADHSGSANAPPMPQSGEAIGAPPPPLVSHPSEALLQIRPAAAEGKRRVVVSFPPLDAVPVASARPADRSIIDEIARASEQTEQMCVNPSTVDGDRLPRVVVGPVIGRVGPTSAVVLLEVDELGTALAHAGERPVTDVVGVRLVDTLSGQRHETSGGVWTGVSGSGPRVFEFETLAPGRRYALRLLGVRQKDQIARTGALCTPLEGEGPATMWALSMLACPATAVDEILADIQTARPTAGVTLTVGPMVDASKVAKALYPMMITAKTKTFDGSKGEGSLSLGDHALNAFRQLYRDAWGEPRTRKLLATCSTISTGGAADLLLPLLRFLPASWLLSGSSFGDQPRQTNTAARRRKRTSRARNCKATPKNVVGVEGALTEVAGAALQASKEYHEALWGTGSRAPGYGGGERGMIGKGPLPRFQRWGSVGVLNVSAFSLQVDLALGQKQAGCGLLSSETWAWLEDFFRGPEIGLQEGPGLNTLIVVTDSPLVWRSPSAARAAEFCSMYRKKSSDDGANFDDLRDAEQTSLPKRGYPCSGSAHGAAPSWSSQPRETAAFLELLFAWAGNDPVEVETGGRKSVGSATRTSSIDRQAGAAAKQQESPGQGFPRGHRSGGGSRITRQMGSAEGGDRGCRAFTVVCPAARVRMNVKTCLRDSETGRVALQWCLASKEGGDESRISMSGSIGPRFSFTHYPQGGKANGPGVTLLRPIPNTSAPSVTFLGMSPLKSGGPGFAFGTLGPVLGEIGTTTARVLVEVSVPMELRLTVQRAGSENSDQSEAPAGCWQQLKKVVRSAHRPIVFDVDNLVPDTRYLLGFSPLANGSTFRASLQTRALRPFSFRVVAFGGCRNPFGFAEALAAGRSATFGRAFPPDRSVATVPLRKRRPYCAVDTDLVVAGTTGGVGADAGQNSREGRARTGAVAPCGWGAMGGGWRDSASTSLAIEAATDGSQLADMARDRLVGEGSDAELVCKELCGRSAWKALSKEVQLPLQGLDLVIHMGNEIHAAAFLNGTEVKQLEINSSNWTKPPSQELSTAENGSKRFILVDPPHLPVGDDGLRASDEEHISKLEEFLAQVHDNSERERKREGGRNNAGGSPNRPKIIQEPSLDIRIPGNEQLAVKIAGTSLGGPATVRSDSGRGGGNDQDGDTFGRQNGGTGGVKRKEDSWGDAEAWRLATEEVAERVRDAYRIAWGLPWARSVMASTPNTSLAFTPLDLDDGYQRIPTKQTASPRIAGDTEAGDANTGDHPASAPRLREEALRAWVEYQSALAGDHTPDEANEAGDGTGGKKRSDKRETDRAAYREYGGVGIITLDVWGNQRWRLDEAGTESVKGGEGPGFHPTALLSKRQEKLIKRALASPSTNALLVCSGTPMVAEPVVHPKAPPLGEAEQKERDKALKYAKKELKKLGKAGLAEIKRLEAEEKAPKLSMLSPEQVGAMAPFYDERRPCFHWSYHSPYLQELLEKLFDWANAGAVSTKKGQPRKKRDVVLICGGTGCGVKTVVADKRTGMSFAQVCVGRMSDATAPCPWPRFEGTIGDRIVFTHSPISTPFEAQSNERNTSLKNYRGSDARTDAHPRETTTRAPIPTTVGVGSLGRSDGTVGGEPQQGDDGLDSEAFLAATDCGASSYALVTVLSEPLDASIDTVLVQPPFSTDGSNGFEPAENEGLSSTKSTCTSSVSSTDQRVAIILGPVLGRVEVVRQKGVVRESCRVPVILEVDRDGAVTCVMRDVATSEVFRLERAMRGRRPRAFWMQGLRPMRRYTIEFEGVVNGADRHGSLRTPNNSDPDLTIVAVSHDQPGELPSVGETNLWAALGEKLGSPWQGVDVVIHIGGQVDLTNAFEDGRACLETLETRRKNGRISEEEEASIMEKLKERFREEYRKVWNQSSTRKVLSSCQHVMMWGQGECRRGYGRGGHAAVASWAGRRLLRLAKEVFREYQRQLWDPLWGSRFQVRDDESFYTTFLWGTVGIFSLDALEIDPQWDIGDKLASIGGRDGGHEEPMIGNSQWQRLNDVLENDEDLITLIVVTDLPVAWYDTEAFFAETKEETPAVPKHLQDHWAARPTQQRALLIRLFQWKADGGGREILLLAGAGRAEGCAAAETKLEFKMPSGEGEQGADTAKPEGRGRGAERGGATEENAPTKAKARPVGISQVTCGPITAEPMDPPEGQKPASGKILVPETEAEKAEKLQRRINSGGGARVLVEEPEPVGFVHITTPGRNYAVLQVIADHDEEGPIGVVDTALATSSSLDKAHPTQELACPPGWWSKRCVGDRTVLFDDDVYMKSREFQATMDARLWLETSDDFKQATSRCYDEFYVADAGRPEELRTIEVEQAAVLKRHIEDAIRAVYRSIPPEIASELAYVPDQMILDFLLLKACPEMKTSAVDTAEKWEEICRQTCMQAAFIRVAALWAEEEEEVALTADARVEEASRKAKAKEKLQREMEVKEAERDVVEMANLLESDPEAHMRRVVQKRADDADRRRREAKLNAEKNDAAGQAQEILEKKKAEVGERLAREAKEREAKEQQELNDLADTDPVEYDRRIKEWHKNKIEGQNTNGGGFDIGSSDDSDRNKIGQLEQRKALARERRNARRAEMHKRPSIGIPK